MRHKERTRSYQPGTGRAQPAVRMRQQAVVRSVLVVDDDSDIRESMVEVLRDEGYKVAEAPDGLTALTRLHEHPERRVVLLDVNMPGMDGRELLEAVAARADLAKRHAYILVTAVYPSLPLDLADLVTRLHIAVVAKPFDIDALLDAVAQAAARLAMPPGYPK
jgi:c-di-GMP phosphodiesterase